VWPFPWWFRPGIERAGNLAYGPGHHHRLDVYRSRRRVPTGSTLIHLHGGGFRIGSKRLEGRPLINRLTRHGWTCISANYRLGRDVLFPDHLVDVKSVIAWAKAHAADCGADPAKVVIAGSSAGAHLAVTAALTPNEPRFQPGFETADTTVLAAVGLYGYYGPIATSGPPSSPHDYLTAQAPPIAVLHGDRDTLVIVEDARAFAHDLRDRSANPVVYAELPGAQHGFDVCHSIRFEAVIDAIETFTSAIGADRCRRTTTPPRSSRR
jgi:acetyl esterase/lipase